MATIGGILVDLGLNTTSFVSDLGKASNHLKSFAAKTNTVLGKMSRGFAKLRRDVADAVKDMFSLKNVMITLLGGGALSLFIKKGLDAADSIVKVADKLGLGTKALQEYRYAAQQSGIAQSTLDMALQRFIRRAGEAVQGTGEAKDALKTLGVELTNVNGTVKTSQQLFEAAADGLSAVQNPAERLRLAFKLFDSEGVALIEMMKDGRAGLERYSDEAERAGLVMKENMLRAAVEAKNKFGLLASTIRTRLMTAVIDNADVINNLTTKLIEAIPAIVAFSRNIADAAVAVADITNGIDDLIDTQKTTSKFFNELGVGFLGLANKIGLVSDEMLENSIQVAIENIDSGMANAKKSTDAAAKSFMKYGYMFGPFQQQVVKLDKSIKPLQVSGRGIGKVVAKSSKEAKDGIADMTEEMQQSRAVFENAASSIQASFSDAFYNIFRNGKAGFKDFTNSLLDIFARALSEMATLAVARPIIVPMVTSMGGMLGMPGQATAGVAKQFGGIGGLGGGGSLFSAVNSFGANFGFGGVTPDFIGPLLPGTGVGSAAGALTSASLSSVLGAGGIGAFGGGMLASALGLHGTGGSVGGGLGAAAGMMIGGPIGGLIGGTLGSLVGGMFGSTNHPAATFGGTIGAGGNITGLEYLSKHMGKEIAQTLSASLKEVTAGLAGAGIGISGMRISGGVDDGRGFFGFGRSIKDPAFAGVTFDPNDENSINAAIADFTVKLAKMGDVVNDDVVKALENLSAEGKTAADVIGELQLAASMQGLRDSLTKGIQDKILAILDPETYALRELNNAYDEIRNSAQELGLDLVQIELAYGLERQRVIEQYAKETTDTVADAVDSAISDMQRKARDLRLSLQVDKGLSGLSVENRMREADMQFSAARGGFLAGTSTFEEVQRSLETMLDANKDYYGFSTEYYQKQTRAIEFLQQIENSNMAANDNAAALLNETATQTGLMQEQNDLLRAALNGVSLMGGVGANTRLLRPGEGAGVLGAINAKNLLPEEIVRQAKVAAGFDFSSAANAGRSFADAVAAGDASAAVFNSIIAARGGMTQNFDGNDAIATLNEDLNFYRVQDGNASAQQIALLEEVLNELKAQRRAMERAA